MLEHRRQARYRLRHGGGWQQWVSWWCVYMCMSSYAKTELADTSWYPWWAFYNIPPLPLAQKFPFRARHVVRKMPHRVVLKRTHKALTTKSSPIAYVYPIGIRIIQLATSSKCMIYFHKHFRHITCIFSLFNLRKETFGQHIKVEIIVYVPFSVV